MPKHYGNVRGRSNPTNQPIYTPKPTPKPKSAPKKKQKSNRLITLTAQAEPDARRARLDRIKNELELNDSDPRHGKSTGYYSGCPCGRCRQFGQTYRARRNGAR